MTLWAVGSPFGGSDLSACASGRHGSSRLRPDIPHEASLDSRWHYRTTSPLCLANAFGPLCSRRRVVSSVFIGLVPTIRSFALEGRSRVYLKSLPLRPFSLLSIFCPIVISCPSFPVRSVSFPSGAISFLLYPFVQEIYQYPVTPLNGSEQHHHRSIYTTTLYYNSKPFDPTNQPDTIRTTTLPPSSLLQDLLPILDRPCHSPTTH